jgi:hypothetical protein
MRRDEQRKRAPVPHPWLSSCRGNDADGQHRCSRHALGNFVQTGRSDTATDSCVQWIKSDRIMLLTGQGNGSSTLIGWTSPRIMRRFSLQGTLEVLPP